ncbi:O-acetyl-ADP-ribose deacetylase [Porticoccus sp. W117]|uniref:O-acetyl-ADP-ribose deacetylase n=1 Tax=Porticoccus sp. W117 TaxID=3054777 RepID=UPI00259AC9DD|nr:O-acetyl-ADP-ribose deacetylase [Porticoccus sp. W117]MDM3869807.1 O-acetyl-ADP-ribose deacetylase [Porticoccus sp. W117]
MHRIRVYQGDITQLAVDAIVNAANSALNGGGGVDGAIHRAAGPQLMEACLTLNGCPTGQVKMTHGFELPARYVLHAVGPIWQGGDHGEADLLASCYRNAMTMAAAEQFQSIAFPAISCGVYRFPPDQAVDIAVRETVKALASNENLEDVVFCCFDEAMAERYRQKLHVPQGGSEGEGSA